MDGRMFIVQKRPQLGFAGGTSRRGKSMNRGCIGKRKFIAQFHVASKSKAANS
jgi:hypothetical protein